MGVQYLVHQSPRPSCAFPYRRRAENEESSMSKNRKLANAFIGLGLTVALCSTGAVSAFAHGYINSDSTGNGPIARAAITSNSVGAVQYEPQSLEGDKGFPAAGPADGKIASAGGQFGGDLDQQTSTRWFKNEVRPGLIPINWKYTAPHKTTKWTYYLTKQGWDQNAPLSRASLEEVTNVQHDGSAASTNPSHLVNIPADRSGYHVLLAVWDIADTARAFYNVVDLNVSGGPVEDDTVAPSVPGTLSSSAVTTAGATVSWKASTDNVGVNGYEVLRDGVRVAQTTNPTFTDTGLKPETAYKYTVIAVDGSGNKSAASAALTVTTAKLVGPDTEAPSKASAVHAMTTTATSVDVMWTAATDNVGVVKYSVLRGTTEIGTTTGTNLLDAGLTPNTSYTYTVVAYDAAGNSSKSDVITVVTKAEDGSTTNPTWVPTGRYTKGDKVSFNGKNYEAVQTHVGSGDPSWITAVSLWRLI